MNGALVVATGNGAKALIETTQAWVESQRKRDGSLNAGVLATAVAVTTKLRKAFPLEPDVVATKSQIKGQTGASVAKVLSEFGETRRFLSEAGRTSRGNRERGIQLGHDLTSTGLEIEFQSYDDEERVETVDGLLRWLVGRFGPEYFDRQRLSPDLIDPKLPAKRAIFSIMSVAIERGGTAAGAVAQHLVGAKLALRFPEEEIGQDNYTTADQQTARSGDFQIGDTAFHVTMSPSEALFASRCVRNLQDGYRPVVIVPESKLDAGVQLAEIAGIGSQVDVVGLEVFVGLNIEEMASFRADNVKAGLRNLLETYNQRIREIEVDLSLQIVIPANL